MLKASKRLFLVDFSCVEMTEQCIKAPADFKDFADDSEKISNAYTNIFY